MSDSDFENREKSVWMAEKHRECVVGFFLAGEHKRFMLYFTEVCILKINILSISGST